MAFRILDSERVQSILQALNPTFIGRDQNHLLALADEAADAGYSAAYDHVQPLYDFRETIESPAGASNIGFQRAGLSAVSRTVQGKLDDTVSVLDFVGVDNTGSTDSTAGLVAAFQAGYGDVIVPDGDYLIAGTGPNSGGAVVKLIKSLRVHCSKGARFFTDSLDNTMLTFKARDGGSGLPVGGIRVEWDGGYFDQQNQKNSTSMPHTDIYPPANPGTTAGSNALGFPASYTDPADGLKKCAFSYLHISNVKFKAGTHWLTAGGDSAIYHDGCEVAVIEKCEFVGCRDVAIYSSRDGTGVAGGPVHILNNRFLNCFFAAGVKRSIPSFTMAGNIAINCQLAWFVDWIVGPGTQSGFIHDNRTVNCTRIARLSNASNIVFDVGSAAEMGALLPDGSKVTGVYDPEAVILEGCTNCTIRGARIESVSAPWAAGGYAMLRVESVIAGGTVFSTSNTFENNIALSGFTAAGNEDAGSNNNRFTGNIAVGAASPNVILVGSNSVAEHIKTTGSRSARKPWVQAVTSAATITPDANTDDLVAISQQSGPLMLANPSGAPQGGRIIRIRIKDNGAARAISYGAKYRAFGVALPTTTAGVGATRYNLYLEAIYNSTDDMWDVVDVKQQI